MKTYIGTILFNNTGNLQYIFFRTTTSNYNYISFHIIVSQKTFINSAIQDQIRRKILLEILLLNNKTQKNK